MKKVSRILTLGALAVIALALPQPAGATCPNTLPVQHGLGSFFTNCKDAQPVDGYIYVLGQDATMNSNSTTAAAGADQKIDFVCEATGVQTEQGIDCFPEAGVAGDNNVVVMYDWGGINLSNGATCPNAGGVPGLARNVIQVVANDGASLIATVGFSVDFGYYVVEAAGSADFAPMECSQTNGMTLVSNTAGLQANTVCVGQTAPPVYTDCDPNSAGAQFYNTCQGGTGTAVTVAPGNLFTRTGPCDVTPDLRRASWTPAPSTPGPGGSKCVSVTVPPAVPVGQPIQCAFVGSSSIFGDGANAPAESSALTGWLRISGNSAANDKVAIKKASLGQGTLSVAFGTENETTIVGFNVYGGKTKLNSALIAAKGTGNNDYSFEIGRGALKNERSITVEAVKSDGTSVRSASVTVK